MDDQGNLTEDPIAKARRHMQHEELVISEELKSLQKELKNTTDNMAAFDTQTKSMVAVATAVQSAAIIGNISGQGIAARGTQAAILRATGGDPVAAMKMDVIASSMAFRQSQRDELAKLPEGSPLRPDVMKRQAMDSEAKLNEKKWELMQYTYAAPGAGIYGAGEATAQAEISTMKMEQMRQIWNEIKGEIINALSGAGGTNENSAYNQMGAP